MPRITAYIYNSAYHCVDCTRKRFPARAGGHCDIHGVEVDAVDLEGNPIHPIFDTDDIPPSTNCTTCRAVITEPFFEQAIEQALREQGK